MGRHFKNVRACIAGNLPEEPSKIRGWLNAAGGQLQTSLNRDTTHVIASRAAWDSQTELITQALEMNIHVVDYDWMHESLLTSTKKPEKKYLWSTIEVQEAKHNQQKAKLAAKQKLKDKRNAERLKKRAEKEEEKKDKAASRISYTKALTEHTDAFLTSVDTPDHKPGSRASSPSTANSQAAKTFREGVRQARNDILSDNYHVYMDKTGFRYDVIVVKTDLLANRNERIIITLYETNSNPRSYAAHARHDGSNIATTSETKSAIGSSYTTAFRVWKSIFKVKTGVEWDDRVEAFPSRKRGPTSAVEALKDKREKKADGGKEGGRVQGGGQAKRMTQQEWANMPFTYRLPAEGQPRGAGPLVRGIRGSQLSASLQADVVMSGGDEGIAEGSSEENAQVIEDDEESSNGDDSDE